MVRQEAVYAWYLLGEHNGPATQSWLLILDCNHVLDIIFSKVLRVRKLGFGIRVLYQYNSNSNANPDFGVLVW